MKQTLIKLSDTHYIVVDDSEIKEGDWYYDFIYNKIDKCNLYIGKHNTCKKVTHSTQPLEEGITIHNIEHKRWVYIKYIDLLEVKELFGEVDVEKEMISPYPMDTQNDVDWCNGYQRGYNQAIEDNKEFIKKPTEWEVYFDENGKLKLV